MRDIAARHIAGNLGPVDGYARPPVLRRQRVDTRMDIDLVARPVLHALVQSFDDGHGTIMLHQRVEMIAHVARDVLAAHDLPHGMCHITQQVIALAQRVLHIEDLEIGDVEVDHVPGCFFLAAHDGLCPTIQCRRKAAETPQPGQRIDAFRRFQTAQIIPLQQHDGQQLRRHDEDGSRQSHDLFRRIIKAEKTNIPALNLQGEGHLAADALRAQILAERRIPLRIGFRIADDIAVAAAKSGKPLGTIFALGYAIPQFFMRLHPFTAPFIGTPDLAIGCLFADIDAICLQVFTDTLQDAPDLCVGIAMFQPEDGELAQGLDALEQMAHLLSQIRAIC